MQNNRYGFYDEKTHKFYDVPVRNQKEFEQFLKSMYMIEKKNQGRSTGADIKFCGFRLCGIGSD